MRLGRPVSFLAAAAALAGCGGGGPKMVPVRGTVAVEGRGPAGVGVTFVKVNTEPQVRSSAAVRPDGTFALKTYPHGDGAEPGRYKVLVELDPREKRYERYGYVQATPIEVDVPEGGVTDLVITVPWKK